jgi:hypothetical protein
MAAAIRIGFLLPGCPASFSLPSFGFTLDVFGLTLATLGFVLAALGFLLGGLGFELAAFGLDDAGFCFPFVIVTLLGVERWTPAIQQPPKRV